MWCRWNEQLDPPCPSKELKRKVKKWQIRSRNKKVPAVEQKVLLLRTVRKHLQLQWHLGTDLTLVGVYVQYVRRNSLPILWLFRYFTYQTVYHYLLSLITWVFKILNQVSCYLDLNHLGQSLRICVCLMDHFISRFCKVFFDGGKSQH